MTSRPDLPGILGNPAKFAVRLELDEQFDGEWLFGRIAYQIDSHVVGSFEPGTSLRDVPLQMHWIVTDAGRRRTKRFAGKGKAELFRTIWNALYGATAEMEEISVEECWAKHNVTIPVDVFDHYLILQFDEEDESRVIWGHTQEMLDQGVQDSQVYEARIPLGTT